MNVSEPNSEPNSAPNSEQMAAIASDNANNSDNLIMPTLPQPTPLQSLGIFLDRLYGTLFLPRDTFANIKAKPSFWQGALVIALVNILEVIRLNQLSVFRAIAAIVSSLIGWLFFTFLLKQLAAIFQKNVKMSELLTLTGFASLPWLFMAPALSLPSRFRTIGAIAVILWFILWQVWSASIALNIKSWKTLAIIPLAISGGVVALIWLSNAIGLIISIL
jgi:hypothetical protein